MFIFDLQAKLKKLNPSLYIKGNGVYLRAHKQAHRALKDSDLHYDLEAGKYLRDLYTGQKDTFIEVAGREYIPEYDEFDLENGTLVRKGWRSLVCSLVRQGYTSKERAQRFFSRSLGEQTYDLLGFEGKLAWARREK